MEENRVTFLVIKECFGDRIKVVKDEGELLVRLDDKIVLLVSERDQYTTVFAKNGKVQFKNGSPNNTKENIVKKVESLIGKGDIRSMYSDDTTVADKLGHDFKEHGLTFHEVSSGGKPLFVCDNPESIGLPSLSLNEYGVEKIGQMTLCYSNDDGLDTKTMKAVEGWLNGIKIVTKTLENV
jgi:hypothetical protein